MDFAVPNSKYFGVPQNRERIFIVGVLDGETAEWDVGKRTDVVSKAKRRIAQIDGIKTFNFDWPEQTEVTVRLRDVLEDIVDEKYYLSEEKTARLIEQLNGSHENETGKFLIDDQGRTTKELRPLEISPTLRRETHGNEPRVVEPQMLGLCDIRGNESIRRVDSAEGISPTLTTMGGSHREPKIAVEFNRKNGIGRELDVAHTLNSSDWRGLDRNQTQNAVVEYSDNDAEAVCECSICDTRFVGLSTPCPSCGVITPSLRIFREEIRPVLTPDYIHKTQNGRRIKGTDEPMFTLTAQDRHGIAIGVKPRYRIRKLTPLECWRLQGFPDLAHEAVKAAGISDSQRYKMAGNAVTVNVIEAIGVRLLPLLTPQTSFAAASASRA